MTIELDSKAELHEYINGIDAIAENHWGPKLESIFVDKSRGEIEDAKSNDESTKLDAISPLRVAGPTYDVALSKLNRATSIGIDAFLNEESSNGVINITDANLLKGEIAGLTAFFLSGSFTLDNLILHLDSRLDDVLLNAQVSEDIAVTYQFLKFQKEFYSSVKDSPYLDIQKRDNRFCKYPGIFCSRNLGGPHPNFFAALDELAPWVAGVIFATLAAVSGGQLVPAILTFVAFEYFTAAIFCGQKECDDCHGVSSVYAATNPEDKCDWGDFVAYGGNNLFEDVRDFTWRIEFPNSTVPPLALVTQDRVLSKADIPNIDDIDEIAMRVDVMCDGGSIVRSETNPSFFPWGEIRPPVVFTRQTFQDREVPNIVVPNSDAYFYPLGEAICFHLESSIIWKPVSWRVVGGLPEESTNGQGVFCTTFQASSTYGVTAVIRNDCTGELLTLNTSILAIDAN